MEVLINELKSYKFSTIEEADKFLKDERHKWSWLTELPAHLVKAAKEIQSLLLDKPIFRTLDSLTADLTGTIKLGSSAEPFITTDSEENKFINNIISNYDCITGFFGIIYSNEHIRKFAYENPTVSESLRMARFEYERVTAMNLSLSLGNYDNFIATSQRSLFQEVLKEQRIDQAEFRTTFKEMTDDYRQNINDQYSAAQNNIRSTQNALDRRIQALKRLSLRGTRHVKVAAKDANDKHIEALNRLQAANTAYTEQLELKYSVTYWNKRKTAHQLGKYGWLTGVMASLITMLCAVSLYFANGGLTTISENLSTRLPSYFIVTQEQEKQIETPKNSIHTLLARSEIASAATNITGAILLITIFSILIRITLRQFSIHTQYALEAGERVTFIKTYLALMQEKQIRSDEDRKLILECIFKSTLAAPTPEIAFSLPIDAIMKVLGDKKQAT